jgi:hypothetical protein
MNTDEKNREAEDAQVESALRHFRESVRGWSEQEYARPRTVPARKCAGRWLAMSRPAMGWGVAAIIAVSAVTVPVARHRQEEQRQIEARHLAEELKQKQQDAERQAALAMNDEELMSHVDSDIAQATPDALEPLASMMADNDSSAKSSKK